MLAFLFLLYSVQVYSADHPVRNQRPVGAPEGMLSGIYINVSSHHSLRNADGILIEPLSDVLHTLGKPNTVINKNKCEGTYIWKTGGVLLKVETGCIFQTVEGHYIMLTQGAYSVEVWGSRTHGNIGRTGRGLALGDSMAKMKRLYGARCECGNYASGTGDQDTHGEHYAYYAQYQWGGNIELDVDADARGHVVHILLMGDIE